MSEQRGGAADSAWLPFLPWYPRDFLSSTRGWPLEARAIYRELLDAQWDMGALPCDPESLQRIAVATDAQWQIAWPWVEPKFPLNGDGRKNPKLEMHRARAIDVTFRRSAGGKLGMEKRWHKDKSVNNPVSNPAIKPAIASRSRSISISRSISKTVTPTATKVAAEKSEATRVARLKPSAVALARAMEGRFDINADDLVGAWLEWATGAGTFLNVDRAFETWARKHEATDAERQRATAARGPGRTGLRPAGSLMQSKDRPP